MHTYGRTEREIASSLTVAGDAIFNSFVVQDATTSISEACEAILLLHVTHVVVWAPRGGLSPHSYLLLAEEIEDADASAAAPDSLAALLSLMALAPTQVIESETAALPLPDHCVVTERGWPIGFRDSRPHRGYRATGSAPWNDGGNGTEGRPLGYTLRANLPARISRGATAPLIVELTTLGAVDGVPMTVTTGDELDILIQPLTAAEVVGPNMLAMTVSSDSDTAPPTVLFKVKPLAVGAVRVRVLAFRQGQLVGVLASQSTAEESPASEGSAAPIVTRELRAAVSPPPDLHLVILERQVAGKQRLEFYLHSRGERIVRSFQPIGKVDLAIDPVSFFKRFFEEIEKLPQQSADDHAYISDRLASKGLQLFEQLVPPALQVELWRLRNQLKSILVQSEEPWIPWELCRMAGTENGQRQDGSFLCEQFAMSRWFLTEPLRPKLSLRRIALVAPSDTGLEMAMAERQMILALQSSYSSVTELPATWQSVKGELATGEFDGWHFTGHASFCPETPEESVILLESKRLLRPSDLCGVVGNLGRSQPVIFLNGCRTARLGFSITGLGGWAERFTKCGAAAFLGATWTIKDNAACRFAEVFYTRLLQGMPLAESVRQARLAVRRDGDPSWLSYTVYGDPEARIVEIA